MPKVLKLTKELVESRSCKRTPAALLVEAVIYTPPGDELIIESEEEVLPISLVKETLETSGFTVVEEESSDGRYRIVAVREKG